MRTSIDARANLDLIEENYRRWQQNPESVDSGWSAFCEGFELGNLPQRDGAAVGDAAAQTFDAARGSGGLVARAPRSRIVRDFPAYTLRGAKTVFTSGRGIAHGDSGNNFAQMPGWRRRGDLHGHGASRAPQC